MGSDVVIRIKCLPFMLESLIDQLAGLQSLVEELDPSGLQFLAHYASGILLVMIDRVSKENDQLEKSAMTLREFRDSVEQQGGSLTLLVAPEELQREVTPWGSLSDLETICTGIEKVFDPNQILASSSNHRSRG